MIAGKPLDFRPGARWKYSNSGNAVLGFVIELVNRQDYGTFLRQQILDPLGLRDTGWVADPRDRLSLATGYEKWSTAVRLPEDPVTVGYAVGGVYSTVTDLARWNSFLLTTRPPIVSGETLAQLLRPRVETDKLDHYGYGTYIG